MFGANFEGFNPRYLEGREEKEKQSPTRAQREYPDRFERPDTSDLDRPVAIGLKKDVLKKDLRSELEKQLDRPVAVSVFCPLLGGAVKD